jgi:hypothetical protein
MWYFYALLGPVFNLLANLAVGFAGRMAPLALVSIVSRLHPLFLFAYGVLFTFFFPRFSTESLTSRHILQKLVAISVMSAGRAITFIQQSPHSESVLEPVRVESVRQGRG